MQCGLDTPFYITKGGEEICMFDRWGAIKKQDVQDRVAHGDPYDKTNLQWSYKAIGNSIGPHLHRRLASKEKQTSGPGLLYMILTTIASTNAAVVHNWVDE